MLIFWRLASVWFAFWFVTSSAIAQVYKADLASAEWKSISAKPLCSITHTIPGFGDVVFSHIVGKEATFHIESQHIIFPAGEVSIETLPPVWRADLMPTNIGKLVSVAGKQPIKMNPAQISLVLDQLNRGINVVFISQSKIINNKLSMVDPNVDVINGAGAVRVILEAKSFASAYKMYQQCTGEYIATAGEKSGKNIDVSRVLGYIKRDSNTYGSTVNKHKNPQTEKEKMIDYIERDVSIYGISIKDDSKEKGNNNSLAKAPFFAADLASADWKSISNPFACSINHNIPGFGKANLLHKAGSAEVFYIESQDKIAFPAGPASVETLPPVWRNTMMPIRLGTVIAAAGAQPITLRENTITQVVTQLSTGMKVMFTSSAAMNKGNNNTSAIDARVMRVVLETRNFLPAYKNYQQCVSELINYTFAQVARTLINYPEKPAGLSAATKIELEKVARYVKADQKVLGILIDAHSDNSETTKVNEEISKQYADWVAAYFAAQGIAPNKIISRWHGEKFPIATNKTAEGRAKNRRVTVRLETEMTRQENEKNAAARKANLEKEKLNPKQGKVTPEDIDEMIEGLDLIPQ